MVMYANEFKTKEKQKLTATYTIMSETFIEIYSLQHLEISRQA